MAGFLVGAGLNDYAVKSYNGGGSSFTMDNTGITNSTLLFISGVAQVAGTDFNVSGVTITTTSATPAGTANVTSVQMGGVGIVNVPADSSVTSAKIDDSSVTSVKIDATVASTNGTNTYSAAQSGSITALTSTSNSIAVDLALNNHYSHTFTEATTLANPTNIVAGTSGSFFLTQHASTPFTLAFGSYYDFAGGTAPTVTATISARDRIDYIVRSSTLIECVWTGAMA